MLVDQLWDDDLPEEPSEHTMHLFRTVSAAQSKHEVAGQEVSSRGAVGRLPLQCRESALLLAGLIHGRR